MTFLILTSISILPAKILIFYGGKKLQKIKGF